MTDNIQAMDGTVDKYIGDCVMAFWNAPLAVPDHRRNACRAALAMRRAVQSLNESLKSEAASSGGRYVPLAIGIGINSGLCCVGNMGSARRLSYSVLGDPVNLASRLEGQSKTYHVDLVVSDTTCAGVRDMAVLELDLIQVKGKTVPAQIFTLLGDEAVAATPAYRALGAHHDRLLACYRARDWSGAVAALRDCEGLAPDFGLTGLYAVYAERIADMQEDPPPADWNGVYIATTK